MIGSQAYNQAFVGRVQKMATRSASVLVDVVMTMFSPRSVVDMGCGTGSWLREFSDRGVSRIRGYDGEWIPRGQLLIPVENFVSIDLSKSVPLVSGYDLALSLEVAEHLPKTMAEKFVESLTRAAPIVIFSAAIPGQGGTNHINLQWPWYWRELFRKQGFVCCDAIRPLLWWDERVDWVYRQNTYVFLSDDAYQAHPDLAKYSGHTDQSVKLTVVDERILEYHGTPDAQSLSILIGAIARKIKRRMLAQ